jgi:Sulfotransferase domain
LRLPNFLCAGVQKSGTTLLAEILRQHPDIFIPETKEAHFFDHDERFARGVEWYQSTYFKGSENFLLVGDVTPSYLYFEYVPERIAAILGREVKFIIMLRNPVDRAYSHYWMSFKRGYERLPFERAIAMEHARLRRGYFERSRFSYISRGFYSEQIKKYLTFFPASNMKFLLFEEFIADIAAGVNSILDFLGCPQTGFAFKELKANVGEMNALQYVKALKTNGWPIVHSNSMKLLNAVLTGGKIGYQRVGVITGKKPGSMVLAG